MEVTRVSERRALSVIVASMSVHVLRIELSLCFTPSRLIKEFLMCLDDDVGGKVRRMNLLSVEVLAGEGESPEGRGLD
ncbi:hypothetical protein DY000_02045904 [Brassica cretica]|uniref:Uncharacterized protein n=1 Tax=Brassica cretica TaxID=69181 RepID=A0ABQ7F483_BRACR|nr:hypothetical protein DY000_02045904 [Brassica cretica]